MLRSPTTVSAVARVKEQCATGAMIAHCCSATSGFAVLRTWLNISRFGPTDTSYHDMNHSPGTFSGMLSCHSPPLVQAGSLGVRRTIAPPVGTPILSAKMPFGPSAAFRMSCIGSVHSILSQSTGGICGARSNRREAATRSSRLVSIGNCGRIWFCSP